MPPENEGQETPVAQSQTAEEPRGSNEPNTTETAQTDVTAPDRAEEKKVDVPQNETSVTDDRAAEAGPTDAGTVSGDTTP